METSQIYLLFLGKKTMTKPDGGPAFPGEYVDCWIKEEGAPDYKAQPIFKTGGGMSLRDYMAAAALQGFIAHIGTHPDDIMSYNDGMDTGLTAKEDLSISSYKYADAMIAEREK